MFFCCVYIFPIISFGIQIFLSKGNFFLGKYTKIEEEKKQHRRWNKFTRRKNILLLISIGLLLLKHLLKSPKRKFSLSPPESSPSCGSLFNRSVLILVGVYLFFQRWEEVWRTCKWAQHLNQQWRDVLRWRKKTHLGYKFHNDIIPSLRLGKMYVIKGLQIAIGKALVNFQRTL